MSRRKLARSSGAWVALVAALTVVATEAALASAVSVDTQQLSRSSPFSGPCTENLGFSPGFAQETSVAVNPRNSKSVLVSWIADGRATDLVMASRDGGHSFSRILVPGLSACTGGSAKAASDPGVSFTADGRTAFFSAIVANFTSPTDPESATTGMLVSRSSDGGFSWADPTLIQPFTGDFWDLPRLTPDPRDPKRAFYAYNVRSGDEFAVGHTVLSTTKNGGKSWSAPRTIYDPHTPDSWPAINKVLVNRDGSLLLVTALVNGTAPGPDPNTAYNATQQLALRSNDGGRTWSRPVTIGDTSGQRVADPVTGAVINAYGTYPSQTVAPNGDIYVSWPRSGATSSQVVVARSTNDGRSWKQRAFKVAGQVTLPTVEVADDGTVGVLYYEIAPKSANGNWPTRVKVATSRDNGRHWSHTTVDRPFNLLSAGNDARPCCFLGDYLGSARVPHGIAWAYSMGEPVAEHHVDAYFTRITTSGR